MNQIFSPDTEKHCIAALLRCPEIYPDIANFISDKDFQSQIYRTLFTVIQSYMMGGDEANIVLISHRINELGIRFEELPGDIFGFLESLQSVNQINAFVGLESFKRLKKISIRREIMNTADKIQNAMYNANEASIEQIMDMADKMYAEKISYFHSEGGEFANIYDSMQRLLEEGDEVDEFGMMGPFKKVNELYGSLVMDGNITLIGARSGVGKTSFGFYYLTALQEKYNVPILHLDMGEMSQEELMYRAVCMFTGGEVPMYHLQTKKWRRNEKFVELVRGVWPRVQNLRTTYENVGGKTPDQILSLIRRFYMSKVGRGNKMLLHLDYLKPFDDQNSNAPEYAMMGHFIGKVKTLITTEVPTSLWTSLQLNRQGITNNKRANQVDDSENAFGVSDRIYQQVSHAFLLRPKLMDEIAVEPGMGNTKMFNVKYRHLGEGFQDALDPVKLRDNSFVKNYIHLNAKSFTFEEIGDMKTLRNKVIVPTVDGKDYNENIDI